MRYSLIFVLAFCISTLAFTETITDSHNKRVFKVEDVEGWKLLINTEVIKTEEWPITKRIISNQLFGMKRFLKDEVIKDLQKIKIYIDIKQKGKAGAEYHPDKKWLIDNGFSPEKAKCVEISNINHFLNIVGYQPWIMLHELMHGYHDQVLGFDNKEIENLYNSALKAGKYGQVTHILGMKVKHYSSTNSREYFAESTEAYFGTNDYYPFVKVELNEYDPGICKFLKKLAK